MVVFDVITWDCPVGDMGECVRIFLTDEGYSQARESEGRGEMKIVRHARVRRGDIIYAAPERGKERNYGGIPHRKNAELHGHE